MVDQDNSPIQIIREKEEDSKNLLAETQKKQTEKIQQLSKKNEESLIDFESILRDKGNEKLKTIKIEATEMAKTLMAEGNKERKGLMDLASSKKESAISLIEEEFKTLIEK